MVPMAEKILAVIPARFASQRFPGKMLKKILGKSLIQTTYENTLLCKSFEKVVIATDHDEIYSHVQSFGAECYLTPPAETGTDRVARLVAERFSKSEIVVNVQGDEPFVPSKIFEKLIQKLKEDPKILVATTVTKILTEEDFTSRSIVKCVMDQKGKALYFSRSPIPFGNLETAFRHLGIYAFKTEFLPKFMRLTPTPLQRKESLEQLKILEHGYAIHTCIVETNAIGVDTPEDLERVILCRENISS